MSNVRINGNFLFEIASPPPSRSPLRAAATADRFVLPPREQRDPPPPPKQQTARPPAASDTAPKQGAATTPAPSCRPRPSLQPASQRRDLQRQGEAAARIAGAIAAAFDRELERAVSFAETPFGALQNQPGYQDGLEPESYGGSLGDAWWSAFGGSADENLERARLSVSESLLFETEALLNELASVGQDDGIFEVILPNGKTLGIAVQCHGAGTRLLLSAADEMLCMRLRKQRTELEDALERRMERSVSIAVL